MWQPMQDRLIIESLPAPERLVTLTDADPYRKFRVIAVGPKCKEVKAGEVVVLPGVAVTNPDYEQGKRLFVREGDVGWIVNA